ncbi:probable beta-D-xylosidase 5 [Durio zibethinus]|uniref:Probable beta-D-xylosidase 5 n=1 Tax=Durio zibethinus TaxID=66656 RepID=A0A6P5YWC7_DURZI|nr:probable beta-D-xylosidase 5 [Durio zibethinus]
MGLDMADFAYCDTTLSYEVRAKDLVDRMTLSEKAHQMGDKATGVIRIGLPRYHWWSEALHGVSYVGHGTYFNELVPGATSFPTVIHTTAAFNQSLWKTIGKAVSTEARAMYNLGNAGLTYWSPVINPVRDPRWGRITETPGEDPFVVGTFASNFVRGLQDLEGQEHTNDTGSRPLKVSACCKHYAAYDIDNWKGVSRFTFDAKVTEQDMVETFLRPFEMCVKDGDVSSVMCSYNRVNGIPTCADPILLKEIIREQWKFNGYIVSDCDSILEMVERHKWLNDTAEDAVAHSLKAGLDLDCGDYYPVYLEKSVRLGKVREAEIDTSLKYLYVVLMRLGFFDGIPSLMSLGKKDICSEEHIELAAQAAREGVVLLKNIESNLPWKIDQYKNIAIIGPLANATRDMIGNYEGTPCRYVSPLKGLSAFAQVKYQQGCEGVKCPTDKLIFPATQAAKRADATILVMGTNLKIENEGLDREELLLPGYQNELITQVAVASKGPVILVIMSAGGVDISQFLRSDPKLDYINKKIKGILWVGHPGQEGGRAIADVIFGKYNPGGRLPLTWHRNDYVDKLPMDSMPLRPVESLHYPGRTYKFYNGSMVYPFGYGLSYTKFNYKLTTSKEVPITIKLDRLQHCRNLNYTKKSFEKSCPAVLVDDITCDSEISVEVEVQNLGDRDGSEVVMVYSKPPEGIVGTHFKQVVGFERVFVAAKKSEKVKFILDACKSLRIVDNKGYTLLPSGLHKIVLGTSSETIEVNVSYAR